MVTNVEIWLKKGQMHHVRCADWFQDDRVHFSSVALEESGQKKKKQKVPRRILHFSDGVLEEYSTDEDEEEEPEPPAIDPVWCLVIVWSTQDSLPLILSDNTDHVPVLDLLIMLDQT